MENIRSYNYKCLNKNDDEYEIDKILGKNIINHLHKFFNYPLKQNTIKNKNNKNKTKKLHH
jgi:hypothetical protein